MAELEKYLYYKLHENILRHHLNAFSYFKTNENNTWYEAVILDRSKVKTWAMLYDDDKPLDLSDCFSITEREYKAAYEEQNYINSQ